MVNVLVLLASLDIIMQQGHLSSVNGATIFVFRVHNVVVQKFVGKQQFKHGE